MQEADIKQGFSVLGDNPVVSQEDDWLNFHDFVRPLTNRLIASLDNTPFTVAVLAEWGQGKTSVMRILQLMLKNLHCPTIWFEPWKYNDKEEVWKGLAYTLISEIKKSDHLLNEIKRKSPFLKQWGAKFLWSRLLGKQGEALVDAVQQEPWSPKLLHDFEKSLDNMFEELYPSRRRPEDSLENKTEENEKDFDRPLVLFVDDLDRCLPNTALAVLEAMKLVLNRPGMIIVMGVAEEELSRAVTAAYAKEMSELEEPVNIDWGRLYVQKIFQIPFHVPPLTHESLSYYVEKCLRKSQIWSALEERIEWCPIIQEACNENLREIKRFMNVFITEIDKASANAGLADLPLDPTRDAPRVFFIQLLAKRFPEFYHHILRQSAIERDLLIRYQGYFLSDNPVASASSDNLSDKDKSFLNSTAMRQFFNDSFSSGEGAPLVNIFSDPLEVSLFIQFGMVRMEAEPAVEKEGAPAGIESEEAAFPDWTSNALKDIQRNMAAANYREMEAQAQRGIKKAQEASDIHSEAAFVSRLSEAQQLSRKDSEAVKTLQREIELYQRLGNKKAAMNSARFLAKSYRHIGDFSNAQDAANQALSMAEELGDTYAQIDALTEVGLTMLATERHEEALEVFNKIIRISANEQPQKALKAELLIAEINRKQGELDTAEERTQKILNEATNRGFRENIADALQLLARIETEKGGFEAALKYAMQENEIRQRLTDRFLELDSVWSIVRIGIASDMSEPDLIPYEDSLFELSRKLGKSSEYAQKAGKEAIESERSDQPDHAKHYRRLSAQLNEATNPAKRMKMK
jgi:tetratricopeptide (TPR) repeat protein